MQAVIAYAHHLHMFNANKTLNIISLDINGMIMKTYKSILVHSMRGKELNQQTPHTLCPLTPLHPSYSPSHSEPLCWLLSLEGGGRYQYDLQMKPNEVECIQTNTTKINQRTIGERIIKIIVRSTIKHTDYHLSIHKR